VTPYLETCIEAFGASRCMFESKIFPSTASLRLRDVWNAFKRVAARYSSDGEGRAVRRQRGRVYGQSRE
jgi:predicted TIM-barrel fold metal-dependent hydrolase